MLTLIEPERMVLQDSELLPDSAKAAIRSYLSRLDDRVWEPLESPELARLVGESRGLTALLNADALPAPGRAVAVLVDVPEVGFTEFRIGRVRDRGATPTYVGEANDGQLSILLLRDSIVEGRITTTDGVFHFRSGAFGLINVAAVDTSRALRRLYLITPYQSPVAAAVGPADGLDAVAYADNPDR